MPGIKLAACVAMVVVCGAVSAQAAGPNTAQRSAKHAAAAERSAMEAKKLAAESSRAAESSARSASDASKAGQKSEKASTEAGLAARKAEEYPQQPKEAVETAKDPCPIDTPIRHTVGYIISKGDPKASRCVIDHLRKDLLEDDEDRSGEARLTTAKVKRRTSQLINHYQARSARQQIWIDLSSLTTGGFGLAAVADSGASQSTLKYLGGAALVPIIVSQFNGHEPTRDLFAAGAVGMIMLTSRYDGYSKAVSLFDAYPGNEARELVEAAERSCRALPGHLAALEKGLIDNSDRGGLLTELKSVTTACDLLLTDLGAMHGYRGAVEAWQPRIAQMYAQDVLMLDSLVVQRDRQLRATPLEVLSGIAASPFSAASTLLTGEDGRQAIGKIKAQEAIGNLDMEASPIRLPPLPKFAFTSTADVAVPSLVQVRSNLPKLINPKLKPKPDLDQDLEAVGQTVLDINRAKPVIAYQQALAADIAKIAAADQLKFTYNTTSRKVEVVLAAPSKPATPAAK